MKKPIIGVDLDDTVLEFMLGMTAYHNRVYGATHERHHFTTFDLHEIWGCTREEATRRIMEFVHSDGHTQIVAVDGSLEALVKLSAEYELIVITARESTRAAVTLPLVERLFGDLFSAVHFLGHQKEKGALCEELGVSFMVDDGLHNAHSVGGRGIQVFLLDQPWNQGDLPPSTMRVEHWDEIVNHLLPC